VNEDNLCNVRREASRHYRNKKREYLKDKINLLESNSKNKNIRDLYRGINEFKNGYQPRTNLVKDEKGDLLADPHTNVNSWMKYLRKLLNVQWVLGRQKHRQQSHLCQSLASLRLRLVLKLKRYKSPGADQVQAELIQAGGGGGHYIVRSTNLLS
jgi:hypothetical protein